MPTLALYDAVPPWAFLAGLAVILAAAALGAARELRARERGRREGAREARQELRPGAPVRAIGVLDAVQEPDRYLARQRWPWHTDPAQSLRAMRGGRGQ